MRRIWFVVAVVVAVGCDRGLRRGSGAGDDLGAGGGAAGDGADLGVVTLDLGGGGGGGGIDFSSSANDLALPRVDLGLDLLPGPAIDLGLPSSSADLAPSTGGGGGGVISGGPCMSGAAGATAIRVRWSNGGGTATPVYEAFGLPDHSREKASAYGYQIGFTPSFVDPYLAQGGLLLDSSDFVDLELSTAGVTTIRGATLALYGRSFNTTTSGSFSWQTFDGVGASPSGSVSNVAPYAWYGADMLGEISPGDNRILLRIKAGPPSGSLVVNRIELCLDAS